MPLSYDNAVLLNFEAVFYEGGSPAGTPIDLVYNTTGSADFGPGAVGTPSPSDGGRLRLLPG